MKIAVLSGKGGTGKTFIATNMAYVLSQQYSIQLLDCDVEEPNAALFFQVEHLRTEQVVKYVPVVDQGKCQHHGKCAAECQFGAIVSYPTTTLVFRNLCHGCGLCATLCPENAISEVEVEIGKVIHYQTERGFLLSQGLLNIGEPSGVAVIRALKKQPHPGLDFYIYDAPPGTSCPVVETLRGVDFALLVTESSPFGLHDLKMVLQIVNEMGIPSGVIINRYRKDYQNLEEFLEKNSIHVLHRIPFDSEIAREHANGNLFSAKKKNFYIEIAQLTDKIKKIYHEADSHIKR